jgi:Zn-dependent membrane protease YugP
MMIDPMYFLFAAPAILLSLYASFLTKSRFKKYSQVMASSGVTGAQAAFMMLRDAGLDNVGIERSQGFLSDHYDPRHRVLRLSPDVHDGRSLSAVGVACHEAGHALQHASAYAPLNLRSSLVPAAQITSKFSSLVLMAGLILSATSPAGRNILMLGVALLSVSVLFTLVTLPVEWDASARAKKVLVHSGIITAREQADASAVLNAAFLTYVAAAVSAVTTLLYWLWRSGLLGGRRN